MLAGARQRARLLTVLALLARRLRRRPRRRRARRPLRRPCHRPRRHRVRGSRVRRRRARRRLLLVRRWGRGRFSNLANSSFINVRGESRTLRSCCSRILLLFCCYCSTLQHCSVPNVHQPYLKSRSWKRLFRLPIVDRDAPFPDARAPGAGCRAAGAASRGARLAAREAARAGCARVAVPPRGTPVSAHTTRV